MYYRIINGKLIQLSDRYIEGYAEVIEHEKPEPREGYNIIENYEIENGEVHKTYTLEEVADEDTDADRAD